MSISPLKKSCVKNNFLGLLDVDTVVSSIINYLPFESLVIFLHASKSLRRKGSVKKIFCQVLVDYWNQKIKYINDTFKNVFNFPVFNNVATPINLQKYYLEIGKSFTAIYGFQEVSKKNNNDFLRTILEIKDSDFLQVFYNHIPENGQKKIASYSTLSDKANFLRSWLSQNGDQLKKKTELFLDNKNLRSVPFEIFQYFPNLEILNLSGNHIELLPPEIGKLSLLRALTLAKNHIRDLPLEMRNLKKLFVLDVSYNDIQKIPIEIENLPHLRALNYQGNKKLDATLNVS
jgi:hypothetical protein